MKSESRFRSVASAVIIASGLSMGQFQPQPAFAEPVFFERKTYSEVLNPKDAQLVEDAGSNENVKVGKEAIKKFITSITSLENDLKKDQQLDMRKRLASEFNAGKFLVKYYLILFCSSK